MIVFSILMLISRANNIRTILSPVDDIFYKPTVSNNLYYDFFADKDAPINATVYNCQAGDTLLYTYIIFNKEDNEAFYHKFAETNKLIESENSFFGYSYYARGKVSSRTFITDDKQSSDIIFIYNSEKGLLVMLYVELESGDIPIINGSDTFDVSYKNSANYPQV